MCNALCFARIHISRQLNYPGKERDVQFEKIFSFFKYITLEAFVGVHFGNEEAYLLFRLIV